MIELLVVISIIALVASIALPSFSEMKAQMRASEDIRNLAADISELRDEAIRLRTNVRISFVTTGYSWDVQDDGTSEGSRTLGYRSTWSGSTPSPILLNGLGLARGIPTELSIAIKNSKTLVSLTINRNGHIQL